MLCQTDDCRADADTEIEEVATGTRLKVCGECLEYYTREVEEIWQEVEKNPFITQEDEE